MDVIRLAIKILFSIEFVLRFSRMVRFRSLNLSLVVVGLVGYSRIVLIILRTFVRRRRYFLSVIQ